MATHDKLEPQRSQSRDLSLVNQRNHNPRVGGSSSSSATK